MGDVFNNVVAGVAYGNGVMEKLFCFCDNILQTVAVVQSVIQLGNVRFGNGLLF